MCRKDINKKSINAVLWAILLLTAVCIISCSKDTPEIPTTTEEHGKPIVFGGAVGETKEETEGSRAAGLETIDIKSFKIYGYKNTSYDAATQSYNDLQTVFSGYNVSWTQNTANTTTSNKYDWEYVAGTQTIKYWDFSALAYRYMSYAPATASVTVTKTADKIEFAMPVDVTSEASVNAVPYYSNLWFSNNNYPQHIAYGSAVVLSFIKPYCRVRLMFIDNQGNAITTSSVQYRKTTQGSIHFKPSDNSAIGNKGTVTISYPLAGKDITESVSAVAAESVASLTEPYEEATAFSATAKKYYNLLPNTNQGTFTLSLTYNGEQRTAVVPAQFMQWKTGYEYTYVFKLTDTAVSFVPELWVYTKWQAGYVSNTEW